MKGRLLQQPRELAQAPLGRHPQSVRDCLLAKPGRVIEGELGVDQGQKLPERLALGFCLLAEAVEDEAVVQIPADCFFASSTAAELGIPARMSGTFADLRVSNKAA